MRVDRLKQLREKMHLTQEQLAVKAGLGSRQIWRYENEETVPDGNVVGRIARALGVTSDYLLGLSDEPFPDDSSLTDSEKAAIAAWRQGDYKRAIQVIVDD